MNNEDMSEIIQKLNNMINISNKSENNTNTEQADVSSDSNNINEDTIKNLINNFNMNNNDTSNEKTNQNNNNNGNSNQSDTQNNSNNFNFDINTILKMKNVMDKMNSSKNDPRSNLLLSLKPYLNNNRKEKLDQYMQFLNISKVIEAFNSDNGVDSK